MIYGILPRYEKLLNIPPAVRNVIDCGGRSRGGTHNITELLRYRINTRKEERAAITRYVKGDIRDSIWQAFIDRIQQDPEDSKSRYRINESWMTAEINGNKVVAKGYKKSQGSQEAKMKGFEGFTMVVNEEANEMPEMEKITLDLSMRKMDAHILNFDIFNMPHANHYLVKNYFELEEARKHCEGLMRRNPLIEELIDNFYHPIPKQLDDSIVMYGNYLDNYQHVNHSSLARYNDLMLSDNESHVEYWLNQIWGLVSSGIIGRIYKGWKKIPVFPDKFHVYGLDFGHTALVKLARDSNDVWAELKLYGRFETTQLGDWIIDNIEDGAIILADPAQEQTRKDLKHYLFNRHKTVSLIPAKKPPGSAWGGISKLRGSNVHYVNSHLVNPFEEEYNNYVRKVVEGVPIDMPNKSSSVMDHAMDAMKYADSYFHYNY